MLPLKLTIEGLYSYQTAQTIDFEKLTSNQLFGIFGSVGSGKSSILEAMVFALYGDTDRLKKSGESRNYNMMNLQSDRMLIDFECLTGKNEKYRFIYEARRNSKRFEDVKPKERRILKEVNGEWEGVERASTEEILGMSYKNFRQTIIIPQGKFRDFIEQTSGDRTKMLQELFQLEKFDLSDKTNSIIKANNAEIQHLSGKYSMLEEFTEVRGKELKAESESIETEKGKLEKLISGQQTDLQKLEALQSLASELEVANANLKKLESRVGEFEQKKSQLQHYQIAYELFAEKLNKAKDLSSEVSAKTKSIEKLNADFAKLENQAELAEKELETAKAEYENRDKYRQQCEDLKQIIKIQTLNNELENAEKTVVESKSKHGQTSEKLKFQLEKIAVSEKELESLKSEKTDISTLKDAQNYFQQKAEKQKRLAETQTKFTKASEELKEVETNISQLATDYGMPILNDVELVSIEIDSQQRDLKKLVKELENELGELKIRQAFADKASHLVDGKACPLCGSEHHPNVAHGADISDSIQQKDEQKQTFQEQNEQLERDMQLSERLKYTLDQKQPKFKEAEKELAQKQAELELLLKETQFAQFNFAEVGKEIANYEKRNLEIAHSESEISKTRQQIDSLRKQVETAQTNYLKAEGETEKLKATISVSRENIREFDAEKVEKYLQVSLAKLNQSLKAGEQKAAHAEQNYETAQSKLQTVSNELNSKRGQLSTEQSNLVSIQEKEVLNQQEIDSQLAESEFNDIEIIKKLLSQKLDRDKITQEIQAFQQELNLAESKQKELKAKMGEQVFSKEQLLELSQKLTQSKQQLELVSDSLSVKRKAIAENQEKLIQKTAWATELKNLELRKENLGELRRLFTGKGFVEYVSSVYLRNLVLSANERFTKMTQNKLSLQLNENNDFEVQDALNGGKTRLLKTLSGGQTFQAALCLALSLAENVKTLNQSEQSFFFLDEGFGTLDRDSLRVVFETLKSLREENRIVGVISHVEEMQQEIEVALLVENDAEKGSLVKASWES
jgi:exonuclease SbcC